VAKVAVYLALGITIAGHKEVPGMWVASSEGAKFWQQVLTELKNRGVRDIFIGCVDGLKGFPEAVEVVFPATQVQYLQKNLRWELGRTKCRCSGA